jgi:hypothetical protein
VLGLVPPTITVKNDASCSRRPDTATRNLVRRPWIKLPSVLGSGAGLVGGACG